MDQTVTIPQERFVARQFTGQARAFRSRVCEAALLSGPAMRAVVAETFAAFKRRRKPMRRETLEDLERRWRELPGSLGQIALTIRRSRNRMLVTDIRVTAATLSHGELSTEVACSLITSTLDIGTTTITTAAVTIAVVSIHALGRRYQRGFGIDDTAVLRDMQDLATAAPALLAGVPDAVEVPTISGGRWLGGVVMMRGDDGISNPAVSVRTFI